MTFKGSSESIDQGGYPSITTPGIYRVKLNKAENYTLETNSGDSVENCLRLEFLHKDEKEGKVYQYTAIEFPPRDGDDEEKTQRTVDRISLIVGKIKNSKYEVEANDWKDLVDKVVAELKPYTVEKSGSKAPYINLKLLGNVYQGRARLSYPRYGGFIESDKSNVVPTFSTKEKQSNQEYLNHVNEKPDKEESDSPGVDSMTGGGEVPEDLPDGDDNGKENPPF